MRRILLVAFLLIVVAGWSQTVTVLKDINVSVNASGSSPSNFITNTGGIIFFTASDPERGTELWTTNGTSIGTSVLKDINDGSGSSFPSNFVVIGTVVYFSATDGINGTELWRSDGTEGGTYMVKDIYPGSSSSSPDNMAVSGTNLYFSANDGTNGDELWKSGGTSGTTLLLTDIYSGSTSSTPTQLTNANGTIYFTANHSSYGRELWKTTGGTASLVEDIYSGTTGSGVTNLTALNSASSSVILFTANTSANGTELWRSSGTAAGTYVIDIFNIYIPPFVDDETGSSSPSDLVSTGTYVYFSADHFNYGRELFRTSGSSSTDFTLIEDEVSGTGDSSPQEMTAVGSTIYFSALNSSADRELYKTTGSSVTLIANINTTSGESSSPRDFVGAGSTVYFSATTSSGGREFYESNGTSVTDFEDIYSGTTGSNPKMAFLGGTLYISATDETYGTELYYYNGTSAVLFKDINGGTEDSNPSSILNTGTNLYFQASTNSTGYELFKSDGSLNNATLIQDIYSGTTSSSPVPFAFNNNLIHLRAAHATKGVEFFVADPSTNVVTLREVNTVDETSTYPGSYGYVTLGTEVYFSADHPTYGYELWRSVNGGTPTLVGDLYSGTGSSYPQNLTVMGSFVYFSATDDAQGTELFRTSVGAGITSMGEINISSSSSPSYLCAVGSTLFFSANNGSDGYELWKTTGSTPAKVKLAGINPGSADASPQYLTNVNGTLFFRAIDGTNGSELWKSDGTDAGTVMVKDIYVGDGSFPLNLTAVGSTLYFTAIESTTYGRELYKSDGSSAGTVMVKDIFSGTSSSSPGNLKNINGTLYFQASNGTGLNLMKTNGTSAGTIVATSSGVTYQGVSEINYLAGNVYWVGTTNSVGKEILYVKAEPLTQPTAFAVGTRAATSIALSWAAASGPPAGYIVIRNTGSLPTGLPVDGVAPAVNSALTSGTGSVAYVGTGTGFTDTGLSASTTYYYRVYAYNNGGSGINIYKPHSPLEGNATTLAVEPTIQASAVFTSNVLQNSITFNWTSGNGSERIVLAKQSASAISETPVDGTAYTANTNYASAPALGTAKVVYKGTGSSVNVTGLTAGLLHQFVVFELNGSSTQTNYLTPGAAGTATTQALDGNQPTNLVFSSVATTSMTLSWTAATAPGTTGYIVTRGSADPSSAPVNMTPYTPGSSSVGGHLVIYNADNAAVTTCPSTGLTAGTTYYYRVYAKTATTTYVTANPLTGIQASLQTEPTGAPGVISLFATPNSLTGTFAAGTGATAYLVLQREGSAVSPDVPVDGTTYAVGNIIGSSTVVYFGTIAGLPFTASGLNSNTIYHYAAFSSAGSGPTINYLTTSNSIASRTTLVEDPIDQPSNFQFSNLTTTSFDVTFNDAPTIPDGYLVVRRAGAPVATTPTDGTAHSVGNPIGAGVVVFVGNGTSFSETGLTPGVTYHYAAVSFMGSGAATNYLIAGTATGSQATPASEPSAQPTGLIFSNRTQTQLDFSFTAATGTPSGYLVLRSPDAAPTSVPVDGLEYAPGALIGSDVVVASGTSLSVSDNNLGDDLIEDTRYFYAVFAFNGSTGTYNYNVTTPLQGNAFTIAGEPVDHPITMGFTALTTTSVTVTFNEPAALPAGYLVVRRTAAAPTGVPIDGTSYTAGNALGDGTVVYVGASPTFSSTGLTASTVYYYAVYPFNGAATSSNYLTDVAPNSASVLTGNRISLQNEPSNQATAISFTNINTSGYSVGFTASDAARYLILRKTGTVAPTEVPVDGIVYPDGGPLGTSTTFTIATASIPLVETGLNAATDYSYTIYAFNGIGGANNYKTTSPLTGSTATFAVTPTAQPTAVSFSSVGTNFMTVSWTAPVPAPGGYLVLRKPGSAPTGVPVSGTAYVADNTIGDGTVAYVGINTNFIDYGVNGDGLTGATDYYYVVFAYNGSGASSAFLTTAPPSGHQLTFDWEPSFQPTDIRFTNISLTGYTVAFTPNGEDFATGHIAIRKNGADPTGAPVDGITYVVGNPLGDGTIAYIGSADTFNETLALAPYHYAIFAYIGSGPSINYKSTTPLLGTVTTDATPPTFTNATAATIGSGLPLKVAYTIADGESGISGTVNLEFRAINSPSATFTVRPMSLVAGNYEATLTGLEVGEQGVFYRVKATNGHGLQGTSAVSKTLVSLTSVSLPEIPAGSEQKDYRIIAIPAVLTNNKGDQVFGASLGEANDGENWRMFHYSNNSTSEITNLANLTVEPGKGYWLISRESVSINAGAGVAVNVTETTPFVMNLTSGWNQIGNPYLFNILWADVNAANSTSLSLKTYAGGFVPNANVLARFEGGFVQTSAAIALNIPTAKNPAAGREQRIEPKTNPIDSDDWEVIMNLSNGDLKNPFGGVGMSKDAKPDYDHFDDFTLPRFMNYVEFNHNKKAYGMTYAKDILPIAENHTWQISVDANIGGVTEISWDNSYFGPNDKQLMLWDEEEQMGIDMREARSYSFAQKGRRIFRVLYGTWDYIRGEVELDGLRIHTISPNPSHSEVRVAFSLPGNQPSMVNVRVVNNLGQQIATVFEGSLDAGYHELAWSGSDVRGERPASGVYLVEVINGEERTSKRLVLK